ncbi:HK97-gp10 family putative phage morphogenesis protein [Falsochrobactrum ovis]|uniref:HK97 gp10 family phage protein n=1 Tax=Falsochrobactrum ovis TaxID=1293442 RepID=A0A364JTJ6_9HYPH|nr:HK97-gp10 family putative phage morphogenesis protein [Falsochrobactrum ovis]RAK27104.1 HK97 gp10 family phage protein [Falsochrobactrum ovis]
MAKVTIKIEGLKELDQALGELPRATGKNVLRRVIREAAEPMARAARAKAPWDEGHLRESIDVSTRLSRRQAGIHRRMFNSDRASVEMFVGPGTHPQGHLREFGSDGHPPHPFMRPAWDAEKRPTLDRIANSLWMEIDKAAKRLARKAARQAAKG